MRSNRPPMPGPGEVYRQSSYPILWIQGIHLPEQLVQRDLRPDITPASNGTVYPLAEPIIPEPNEAVYDPEMDEDEDPDSDLDEGGFGTDNGCDDSFLSSTDGLQQNAIQMELELEERERELALQRERELEDEGERIKESLQDASALLGFIKQQVDEAARYPAGHRHLREITGLDAFPTGNFKALLEWAQRRSALDKSKGMVNTWDQRRRGAMFKN
jgi:hypothetical protein